MKRLILYVWAIYLFPQLMFASVLVGRTEGELSISPSGAAIYTIPISIQKGLSDFAPEISLSYNSQTSNGIAGMGWNISGLSAISIVPRCIYFDGQAEAIHRSEDNAYALDGMRLLLLSGVNGHIGATYRTENEQYSIIKITNSSNGTPATFQVKTTDGTTYMYGSSSGKYTLGNGETYQWALDYAEDILGNYISYSYSQEGILYPTSITYGRNIHGTNGVNCVISFNYESRPDSISSYMFGYQNFFKKRLKSIVCKYNGNTYRTYTLNYSEDVFSRLASVTESGTSSSTLRPTTFEWSVPQFQVGCSSRTMETINTEDLENESFFSGDLDGDGITEIINIGTRDDVIGGVHWPYLVFWGRKWNPDSQRFDFCYSAQTQSGIGIEGMTKVLRSGGLVMHITHGEGNTLVFPYCQTDAIKAFRVDIPDRGWNYNLPLKGMSDDMLPYMILDADRDGLDEFFVVETDKYGNKYPAYLVKFNLTTGTDHRTELSLDLQGKPDKVRCADFNCDGMPDLLITTTTGYYIYWNRSGSFSDADKSYGTAFGKCDIMEVGDFNGDGLPDLIINKNNSTQWYIARNTGNDTNGYFALQEISYLSQAGVHNIVGKEKKLYCIVQDIDGDGKSDAVVGYPYTYGDGGHICILKSNGNTLTLNSSHDFPYSGDFPDANHIIPGIFDGHGGMEIMYHGKGLGQNTSGWHMLKNPSSKASSQKLISVTDGLGAKDSISYGLLTDNSVYSVTKHHSFPLIRLAGCFPVVTSRTESIPSDSRTTSYSYANGIIHLRGKGFLGFEDIKAISSTGIVTDTHMVLDSTFYVLFPGDITESNTSDTISIDHTKIFLQTPGPHSYSTSQRIHYILKPLGYSIIRTDCYDYVDGFPASQETLNDKFSTLKEITYWDCNQNGVWIKGLPEEIDITKSGNNLVGVDIDEKITYQRNPSNGLVLKETKRRGEQIVSTDGYAYNEYGQMTLHYTVPYSSTDTLVTRYEYYPTGKLKKEYDPKGLSKTYYYNSSYGTLSSVNDFDGITTYFSYDGLFRETNRHTSIESHQTVRALSNYGEGAYSVRESGTGETTITTYYDAWDRKTAEAYYLADGSTRYQDYQYLSNGKIGFASFPHRKTESATEGTTYTYDNLHRLTSAVDSNGKTSTWSYLPSRVTSCIDGKTTTTDYYTEGVIDAVRDASGYIMYDYNADGNISLISSSEDYETSYTYDSLGRLVQTTDMNGVTKKYSYDSHGYPYKTTIAGSVLETNYDKYGILRSKSWSDPGDSTHTVNYTYDNHFRLTGEAGEGYQNTYSYDSYGRMTSKYCSVSGNQAEGLYASIHYGSDSRVDRTSYNFNTLSWESSVIEDYSYSNGYIVRDALNDTLVWKLESQDRWGNVTSERDTLGFTEYSFDDYGNMLSLNRRYNHQPFSDSYTYNVQTGNMTGKNNVSFSYDSMNRLTGWGNYNYSYDNLGNITHQPFVGDFSYDGFRVTDIEAEDSLLFGDSLRISYYKAIERPRSIENGLYKADFCYDGNGDRYMMKVFKKEGGAYRLNFTRYYLDGKAEITKDTLGHYSYLYYAGEDAYTAPAVMVIDENEASDIYRIIRDNMGSAIQYESAAYGCYRNSYSPWGVRTHQAGGSTCFYRPGEEPAFGPFYRTYTGHEDLWMFGLLNANARLYSPYLGRFVSPDPLLCEDGGLLDFNPYVYARNNPCRYIDRNGEFWWLVAAAVFGGGFNVMANFDNINGAGDFFKFFGVGAAAGAAGAAAAVFAPVAIGGFAGGAISGAIGGASSGFVLGGGNALLSGENFWSSAFSGMWQGALTGAAFGGVMGGIQAKMQGNNFWNGNPRTELTCHRPTMTEPDAIPSQPGFSDNTPVVQSQKPLQNHHYATNKNTKYTPKMEEIVKKYDLDLNGEWNIEKLPHQGRHPNEYHDFILEQMHEIDVMPNMNKIEFINQFEQRVKIPIRNNPDMLYKKFWQQKIR